MKHNSRFNVFGLFAAASLLLAAACVREPMNEIEDDGFSVVRFTVRPESLSTATRSDDGKTSGGMVDYSQNHISDGTKAKLLVYAVYDGEGNLLPEFGERERAAAEAGKDVSDIDEISLPNGAILGEGQSHIKDIDHFPVTVVLRLKRGETYKVAFWAQEPGCKFYDIHDLREVKVHYAEIESIETGTKTTTSTPNNDESRDAFCRVETLKIEKKSDENRTVYLYRPLAQINVGSAGYDFETAAKMKKYAYTRIQIASAARYLDVVNDQIVTGSEKENRSVLEFGYAPIPAYINCNGIPEDLTKIQENEEFLQVHLYGKDDYLGYTGLDQDGAKTETFKYLSMCYVLVPSDTERDGQGNTLYKYKKTAIDRMRVWIATDDQGTDEKEILDLSNVDVTRNWRTNIVGNIMTTDVDLSVVLDPIYAGDYNGLYEDGEIEWSGWLDESHGAWYDAAEDEILISNAGGLLWLQQMVNGDLVYTVDAGLAKTGGPIKYYDENHVEHEFGEKSEQPYFKGIPDPTKLVEDNKSAYKDDAEYNKAKREAEQLKARILRATHQDKNPGHNPSKSQTWPENKNFHFVGADENDRANVKLVADIDLSGIEWLSIGFDCKMDQTFDMLCDNGSKEKSSKDASPYDKKKHRGFFGHFDGNGHTVSNLTAKRFSMDVHPSSMQQGRGGPYEAVQWYARGFFGQLGGAAIVENLTLHNVDIHGYHCVGGIAGAAIGVHPAQERGKQINIINCVVDGGTIENVPMYRGDDKKDGNTVDRTWARGVNTGGIVGLYNASGSVDGNRVSNLTIDGYRMVGGIVGSLSSYYLAYTYTNKTFDDRATSNDKSIFPKSISNNMVSNTVILADHFKPFATFRHEAYNDEYTDPNTNVKTKYTTDWAYGFSWGFLYNTFVDRLVGGDIAIPESTSVTGNAVDGDDVQVVDLAGTYHLDGTTIKGRTTDLHNVPVDLLPVLDNWFVDEVQVTSNLIGDAKSYKRYQTKDFAFFSTKPGEKLQSPFNMFDSYERVWDKESGLVGMYVGAVDLDGKDKGSGQNHVLSVRGVTGEKDCAVLVSACDRTQFQGGKPQWYTSAATSFKSLSVRGNPYAYTGICLAPNPVMNAITISDVAVYDVYQTLALADLDSRTGYVWPKEVDAAKVDLNVDNSNLRGYTVPGTGWNSVAYTKVVFEKGARILAEEDPALATEYTCKVEATVTGTTFTDCTFKAPFIIDIADGANVTLTGCKAVASVGETDIDPEKIQGCKRIEINTDGTVNYVTE